ncbi:Uncharacterised protein [Chryseobacterium gleum]|uniref:Uncharacterized protein n=1 Tax=Chryseobacterium gleum TaxID=250 RepID=A0A448B8Y1_CHRGE|nr:Uncharacterised protein [Chryseobacterium gleum]VFA43916.1 Uncharacterised protein [Chryseobacterium indologenes]
MKKRLKRPPPKVNSLKVANDTFKNYSPTNF